MKFSCLDVAHAAALVPGRPRGKEHPFQCPQHQDDHPSLTINVDRDVWMCGPCHAGGTAFQLAAFLCGVPPSDKVAVTAWLRDHQLLSGNSHKAAPPPRPAGTVQKSRRIVCTYQYRDEHDAVLYEAVRYDPKGFTRRRPDGRGGWIPNLVGVRLVPFGLEHLVDNTPDVFVPEGEKDVGSCRERGLAATCNIGGAGQWRDEYSQILVTAAGVQRAYVVPDHDVPGHRHAAAVAQSLHAAGVKVRVLSLPGLHDGPPAPKHGRDLSDWFMTHDVAELRDGVAVAPVWTPPAVEPPPTDRNDLEPEDDRTPEVPSTPAHWQRLDLAELAAWPCDPLVPIVDGWFARRSLVYVAAETQTGKTLLFLYVIWRLVYGGRLFDHYDVNPVERVAYLVLEDPGRRIKDRFLDMAKEFPDPIARDRCVLHIAPGFTLTDRKFLTWLEHIIVAERRQLVVLDTYQKATPGVQSFDDKAQGPILHYLADLTRRLDVTLVVIDHIRKQANNGRRRGEVAIDDIKGSGGKAQNADAVILLARTPDRKQLKVQCFGKDFDEPVRILLRVAPRGSADPKFTYVGELEALGHANREKGMATHKRLLEALPPGVPHSIPVLAAVLKLSESTVKRHIQQLITEGLVDEGGVGPARRVWGIVAAHEETAVWAET